MKRTAWIVGGIALVAVALAALVWMLNLRGESPITLQQGPATATGEQIARGAYLARAGNCMTCHTDRGGAAYAGGRAIETPFGAVYSSNLTPDRATGIGDWTPEHFWRAMHNGRSKDGRLLYPAFPYTSYTQVTREDTDAIYAFLQSRPAIAQQNRLHALRFPFDTQAALAAWRALYFVPGADAPDASRSAEFNRGAYLVKGLGHCSACHGARNALGGTARGLDLAGGLIPVQNWYAPSLTSPHEAGVGAWAIADIAALLKNGVSAQGSVAGPMTEVVQGSTQYLNTADLTAMATFLKSIEVPETRSAPVLDRPASGGDARGEKIYTQHCAQCHGESGRGVLNAYPPLAGNRAVTMQQTSNLVQIVLNGGYPPATDGNPRPFGMPPFVLVLSDAEIAQLLTHIRQSWGNQAGGVSTVEVNRIRANAGR
jgi:mono/diheme cytochrome c family protein